MSSKRQQILEQILTRLEAIRKDDGFQTDAGDTVLLGESPLFGEDDPDVVIAVIVIDDAPAFQGEKIATELPIEIQALANAFGVQGIDVTQQYVAAEAVLSDIKTAIELEDRRLGGLIPNDFKRGRTRTLRREPGSTTVGVGITYLIPYTEKWGAP